MATPTSPKKSRSSRVPLVKMHVIDYEGAPQSNAREKETKRVAGLFGEIGALPPPHAPELLGSMVEDSNIIPQCIEAYVTNCERFGHRLVPIIDLTKEDADQRIRDVIYLERLDASEDAGQPDIPEPTDSEVAERRKTIESEMRKEHARLSVFFDYCTDGYSFEELRARTRRDKETNGNGYWEVIRNGLGRIVELKHIPSYTIRLLPQGPWMQVPVKIRVSPITMKTVAKWRRFRRFVQICEGAKTYFKEFGDARVMSSKSGKYYSDGKDQAANVAAMNAAEAGINPATELWSDCLYNATGPYGLPRWIGNFLSVLGSHKAEYVNYLFFDNKSIPPLAVMVEGGRLSKQCAAAFKDLIENKMRGAKNFHKAIILEASPSGEGSPAGSTADGKVRIKIQPLTDAILKDGLFMEYDGKNRDKIGESFRLPKILRGDSSDVNRATADAALAFAEQQVFSGERNAFDYLMDRTILTDMDVLYHKFESLGPDLKNAEALATAAKAFENALNRNEIRQVAEDVFGREYKPVEGGDVPFALTLAEAKGLGGLGEGTDQGTAASSAVALAKRLVEIRKAIAAAERQQAAREFRAEKRDDEDAVVIKVPAHELAPFIVQE